MKLAMIVTISCWFSAAQTITALLTNSKSKIAELDLSEECLSQYEELDAFTFLQMFDASTKLPNGILALSVFDLGNFDECYNIKAKPSTEEIYGKYCLGTIPFPTAETSFKIPLNKTMPTQTNILPPQVRMLGTDGSGMGFHFAICIPNKCNVDDAHKLSIFSKFKERYCYTKIEEPEFSTGAILTTVFLGFFLGLLVISSLFDIYLYYAKKEAPYELMIAFSALRNGRKIFSSSTNPDQLLCLNGIKAISMMWVIIGHGYSVAMGAPFINIQAVNDFTKDAANMWMNSTTATLSVDTFFVVGGLVTVYTFLKSVDKGVKFNLPLYYLHRFLRLNPAFGATILIYTNLAIYMGKGPLWGTIQPAFSQECVDRWYATFFYFSNFYHTNCLVQSWYLSVDMQLFLLSPLILIPLTKWKKATLGALGWLIILGIIIPFTIGYVYELDLYHGDATNKQNYYYYIQTHTRFAPYVIGMLLGYSIYEYKKTGKKPNINISLICVLWLVAIGGLFGCLYGTYDFLQAEYSKITNSLVLAFQRQIWSALVGAVIYLCVTGYGGPIDSFLSLPVFQFLTKLSYSMYLMHLLVIGVRFYSMKTLFYFSNYQMMTSFWGDFMLTLAVSLVLCLTFESPIIIIEKHLFGRGNPRKEDKKLAV